ncbi:MAG: recombinase family protein [Defluviitaleaceae bacterium]|nr:recombinase family protein [Defluviitaleaceae bacterium]
MKETNVSDVTETWNAFGYTRISKDDRDKDKSENNSIKNQQDLILGFAARNPDICIVKFFADEGATGTNFDRTAFKDMITHIENGAATCVIVKDFSRLGRDHIETGKYIERYFASKKIRFISINDGYDSFHADMSDSNNSLIVPFLNIMNEATVEDISIKTRSQLEVKRNNGEFVCNYAAYGYTKSADKKLVVDEYAAEVVNAIFEHKLLGHNEQQIATMLNAKGIHSPAEYKKSIGETYNTPFAKNEKSLWTPNAIRRILTNRIYIGHLEQGKRTKVSYRVKKYLYQPRAAWSIHEDNHEPIIAKHDFELVQELMAKDTRISTETGQLHLFSGIILCGACDQPMTVKITKKKSGKSYINYICSTHKRQRGTCTNNNVSSKKVEKCVLFSIKKQVDGFLLAEEVENGLGLAELKKRKKAALEAMIDKELQSIKENNDYLVKSYAHMLDGLITKDEYDLFRDDFLGQIESAEKHIDHLKGEIERLADDTAIRKLIERFKAHENLTALDRRIVIGFVHSIIVHSNKDLEINLRYDSDFELPAPYEDCETARASQETAVV